MEKITSNVTLSNASFMATSLLGIVLSIIFVIPASPSWGIAFTLTFSIMFISSMISLEQGPIELSNKYNERTRKLEKEIAKTKQKKEYTVLDVSEIRKNRSNNKSRTKKKNKKTHKK